MQYILIAKILNRDYLILMFNQTNKSSRTGSKESFLNEVETENRLRYRLWSVTSK